ncbi:unnamed protein product [Cuscuta campestris]|uniref:Uncharacterized protein n=1 Tax=Cuscuta campestris TaxID=132261 RepID=A0A484NME9_9ASTE|nr:unnamed protein product [Cuscuta campestris]VFR01557.1 unnamed protein product [Cuscuta campestris]
MEEDVGAVFRRRVHKMEEDDDQDIVTFIRQAISVASVVAPDQLNNHRTHILKLLFNDDHHHHPQTPINAKKKNNINIIDNKPAAAAVSCSRKIRIKILKKKPHDDELAAAAFNNNSTPGQEAAAVGSSFRKAAAAAAEENNKLLEAAKRNLSRRYAEVAENKAKRKIQCIGASETTMLLSRDRTTAAAPNPKRRIGGRRRR